MSDRPIHQVVRQLRHLVLAHEADWTDAHLLQRFLGQRDQEAFAALVRRHGPLVLGVCRRVLGNADDADDAFQATFLVLVRKAASLRADAALGNWLYGVAYRTALKARSRAARRRAKEQQVKERQPPAAAPAAAWHDVQPILDEELSRLPDKYRVPVVLCDLEGKTRKEAAGQLRLPEGTISSRLATARRMLAKRLTRRGVTLSGGALAAALAESAAVAVPAALADATVQAASASLGGQALGAISTNILVLTEDVMKAFLLSKLKVASACVLLAALLGVGAGNLLYPAAAGQAGAGGEGSPAAQKPGTVKKGDGAKRTGDKLAAVLDINFKGIPVKDALDYLTENAPLNVIVDHEALKQANLDQPVRLRLKRVTYRTALKHVLRQGGLGYILEDDILTITTAEQARAKMVRKVYPAADLADLEDQIVVNPGGAAAVPAGGMPGMGIGGMGIGGMGGGMAGQILEPAPGRRLMLLIRETVEPTSWTEQGGAGTIAYLAKTGCLVVSQCSEIQDEIHTLLEELRAAKKKQEEEGLIPGGPAAAG
jgi:RNA polymerase sigma factor (sigma-70 family)